METVSSHLSRIASWFRQEPFAFPALFLVLLWLQLFLSLMPFWSLGTYYDYGWFVPLASAWFFWKRWPTATKGSLNPSPLPWPKSLDAALLSALVAAVILLFLIRVVGRYDLFWRPPRLFHFALVGMIHHVVLARFLGWRNSVYFLPITVLCLTAVPLPYQVEQAFIQRMTQNLMVAAEPLCLFLGLPVELSGSAFTMNGEVLQVDEGCSGIRSFQSLFMTSVFVGELFLLGWIGRMTLVLLGVLFAFVFNTLRVLVLTGVFFRFGEDAFHAWHDSVGMTTFALSAVALLGISRLLERRSLGPALSRNSDEEQSRLPAHG